MKRLFLTTAICAALALPSAFSAANAQTDAWRDTSATPDARAAAAVKAMTQDEKLSLVFGYFSTNAPWKHFTIPAGALPDAAGFVPGIARLGIPAQWETDAGVGVATQRSPTPRERTSLPSGIATAATWNPEMAFAGGAMIGNEARLSGFNVQLAGGVNLLREPRNGRNFEYSGEDPLLAGTISGNEIKGIQSNHIISTVKHYALNDQSTSQSDLDGVIADAPARTSDLLAFQIATEVGDPGSVMCSYNIVNGKHACENDWLLNDVLKTDWGYKGYVMSDWGATHSTVAAAVNGLDQESGYPFDDQPWFAAPLKTAIASGQVPQSRIDDMATRIVRSMFANGLIDDPVAGDRATTIDYDAHAVVTRSDAEEAIVLLKNDGDLLPLTKTAKTIAIIGGHADKGVLSGGGSSQVYPRGGLAVPNEGPDAFPGPMVYFPSSPLKALASRTTAKITYADGKDVAAAAKLAAASDVVIVFATQWTAEGMDVPDLNLPHNQDALIAAIAKANPKTVVVLETGGPVVMPWLKDVGAVVEAWFPGTAGGEAIARVLSGKVNPSGHLPATFPASLAQLPRPVLDGEKDSHGKRFTANYNIEGAAVGYRWFDAKGLKPLFPFGYGLSYSRYSFDGLAAAPAGKSLTATFTLHNIGKRDGKAVAQIYVSPPAGAGWEAPKRLGGWVKTPLQPGEGKTGTVTVDPRLLGVYDSASKTWKIAEGDYKVMLATSATDIVQTTTVHLAAQTLDVRGK